MEVIDLTSDRDDEGNQYEESEFSFDVFDDDSIGGRCSFLNVVRRFLSFF